MGQVVEARMTLLLRSTWVLILVPPCRDLQNSHGPRQASERLNWLALDWFRFLGLKLPRLTLPV